MVQKLMILTSLLAPVYAGAMARAAVDGDRSAAKTVRVALVQFDAVPEQPQRNLGEMERLARESVAQGARIVMFHEGTMCDYTPRLDEFAERVPDGPACRRMGDLARQLGCFIIFGLSERDGGKDDERFYITQVVFGPKGFVYRYRKTWLWRDEKEKDRWYRDEVARYDPGTGPELFMIDGIAATCFICCDGDSPRCIQRAEALRPELVFWPSNHHGGFPDGRGGTAKEIGAPLLITNRVGDSWEGGCRGCLGATAAFDAQGNMLAKANVEGREEVLVVDLAIPRRVR